MFSVAPFSGVQLESSVVRRSRVVRRRRLGFNVCRGRLGGATWLLHLLHPHGKMIGF
jgi:hypothetical protein